MLHRSHELLVLLLGATIAVLEGSRFGGSLQGSEGWWMCTSSVIVLALPTT